VGGLLSLYALTGADLFKEKARHVVDKLMPAFNSPTGKFTENTSEKEILVYPWIHTS
jgi:uncharacterized protein YyaL (SSP411 family)